MPAPWTAIVLAGGRSSRLGTDKVQARLDDLRLIDHCLAALPEAVPVIVVGPDPAGSTRSYTVTREPDPGSGPVAAIAAGLNVVITPVVGILAVDMPFAGGLLSSLVEELAESAADVDAVIPLDPEGREQPLAAAYRTRSLARALQTLGTTSGRSVRDLRAGLVATSRPVESSTRLLDVDTPGDLDVARRSVRSSRAQQTPEKE